MKTAIIFTGRSGQGKTSTFFPALEQIGFTAIEVGLFAKCSWIVPLKLPDYYWQHRQHLLAEYEQTKQSLQSSKDYIEYAESFRRRDPFYWENYLLNFIEEYKIDYLATDAINPSTHQFLANKLKEKGFLVLTVNLDMRGAKERGVSNRVPFMEGISNMLIYEFNNNLSRLDEFLPEFILTVKQISGL